MKRYRVLGFDLDSRASTLGMKIQDSWSDAVKRQWEENQAAIRRGLVHDYGEYAVDHKAQNLIDLGNKPFSVIAFHNTFLGDCRDAFIVGAYFPALVGVCALGERVLNHLMLRLRDYYKTTDEYKAVYRKDSFDNWGLAIRTLRVWGVLTDDAAREFGRLEQLRNRAIHFHPDTDLNDRELALAAIIQFQECVLAQFSGIGSQAWFIPDTPGEAYIRKKWEAHPFVREVYLPNCALVGPYHRLEITADLRSIVHDDHAYPDQELTDDEYIALRRAGQ